VIRIRIQYDKYNRMFKLLDGEFGRLLGDGDVYELPVSLCEFCPNHDSFISGLRGAGAHAEDNHPERIRTSLQFNAVQNCCAGS